MIKITPEQSALLDGLNFRQYPAIQELSDGKGTTLSGDKQGSGKLERAMHSMLMRGGRISS